MADIVRLTIKEFTILATLLYQNTIYLSGSKMKFKSVIKTINKLKEQGLIDFSSLDTTTTITRWERFYEIHAKDLRSRKFTVIDVDNNKVFLRVE